MSIPADLRTATAHHLRSLMARVSRFRDGAIVLILLVLLSWACGVCEGRRRSRKNATAAVQARCTKKVGPCLEPLNTQVAILEQENAILQSEVVRSLVQ